MTRWEGAPPYVRRHLLAHGADADCLSDLIADVDLVAACDPQGVKAAIRWARLDGLAAAVGPAYRSLGRIPEGSHARGQVLMANLARLGHSVPTTTPWRALWGTGGGLSFRAVGTLTGHTYPVTEVACTRIGDRPVAVTGSEDGTTRVWDLATGEHLSTLTGHPGWVSAVACTRIGDRPVAVTGNLDRTARVWDLAAGAEDDDSRLAVPDPVRALAAYEGLLIVGAGVDIIAYAWTGL